MRSGATTCWRAILFQTAGTEQRRELPRGERLAALYRFQNGQTLADLHPVDPGRCAEITDPAEIDWTDFPVVEALEAVTKDELAQLRSLLHADAAPTPPHGMVWGLELRGADHALAGPRAGADSTPLPPSSEA